MRKSYILLFVIIAFSLSACATPMTGTQKGAATGTGVGAATGAILGQVIGRDTKSTLLGAAAGAVVGGLAGGWIGTYMDKQQAELQRSLADTQGATVERQQNELLVTFKSDVMFDVNSARLKSGAYADIEQVADILNRYPETRVRVDGFTDSTGSEDHNLRLSEERAFSVKDALVDRGVDPARISARGYGEAEPIASNNTEAGRQLNRRVTLRIIPVERNQ